LGGVNIQSPQNNLERKDKKEKYRPSNKKNKASLASSLLHVALIAGSISIFSNSITGHNAGVHFLPSLSISLDWVHFMAVSIWVGGLFYISSVLLAVMRTRVTTTITTTPTPTTSNSSDSLTRESRQSISDDEKSRSIFLYYLALLLPRFSLLATISLGVIGVSGLCMAWIHLHTLNSLFSTAYGNILIIKLSAALPLVFLGAYHQVRLHRSAVLVASVGQGRGRKCDVGRTMISGSGKESSTDNKVPVSQTFNNNNNHGVISTTGIITTHLKIKEK
jgi:copper transport protein